MIVCKGKKLVYLHIPKTAGNGIFKSLGLKPGGRWAEGCRVVGTTKHHVVRWRIPRGYFVFAFVRNPWDRILSYYMFRSGAASLKRRGVHPDERMIPFTEWLERLEEFGKWEGISRAFHIAIQSQNRTVGHIPDFIGRFENLEKDFAAVCVKLGLDPPPLQRHNVTPEKKKPYTEYYEDRAVQMVARMYRDDIERFGYEFGA